MTRRETHSPGWPRGSVAAAEAALRASFRQRVSIWAASEWTRHLDVDEGIQWSTCVLVYGAAILQTSWNCSAG